METRIIDPNKPQASKLDLATHFSVTTRTVNTWITDPNFPCYGRGKRLRFKLNEVEQYLKNRKAENN